MLMLKHDRKADSQHHDHRYIVVDGSMASLLTFASNIDPISAEEEIDFTETEQFLKLNIGGNSFRIRANTVHRRLRGSRLAKFLLLNPEARKSQCDGYLSDKEEYCFERSAKLFGMINNFYLTGKLHRPQDVRLLEFLAELDYWQIPWEQLAPCCQRLPGINLDKSRKRKKAQDPFQRVIYGKVRRQIWDFCEGSGTFWSNVFSAASISIVLLSVSILIIGSIPAFQVPIVKNVTSKGGNQSSAVIQQKTLWEPHLTFGHIEKVCITWFTFEYVLRFCVSPVKCKFVLGVMNLIDMITILFACLELAFTICGIDIENLSDINGALLVARKLRVLRVVRILKLGRYSSGMEMFARTLQRSAKQFVMMGMVWSTAVVFFSTLVYFIEKDEEGTSFHSIPAAFWWCIVTMTTVGYGDMVPSTIPGKFIAGGAIVSGVLVLALPITIIVDNFMKVSENSSSELSRLRPKNEDDDDIVNLFRMESSEP